MKPSELDTTYRIKLRRRRYGRSELPPSSGFHRAARGDMTSWFANARLCQNRAGSGRLSI
jgi:hypothetical protein